MRREGQKCLKRTQVSAPHKDIDKMSDKIVYQLDQLEQKVLRLNTIVDSLLIGLKNLEGVETRVGQLNNIVDSISKELTAVEKDLLILRGEANIVGGKVNGIVEARGWVLKSFATVAIAAVVTWVIGGGLDK